MPSDSTFTKVSVDHEKRVAVAVTFDGDDGSILRIETVEYSGDHAKPHKVGGGMNVY